MTYPLPDIANKVYAQCRREVDDWYVRGLLGTTSTTQCANRICDPLRAEFANQVNAVGQAVLDTAYVFGKSAGRYEAERVSVGPNLYQCEQSDAEARFVTDCIDAMKRQFPYLERISCTTPGETMSGSGPFWQVCRAALEDVGRRRIRSCGCPEGLYKQFSSSDTFTCSHAVPSMVGMIPGGLPVTREESGVGRFADRPVIGEASGRGSHTVPNLGPCPSGWSGDYPNCCEPGTASMGGACVQRPVRLPPRVASPPLISPRPTACPPGWGGDYPNCCEPGAVFMGGACVQRRITTLPPRVEWPPTAPSPTKLCPPGTRLSDAGCLPIDRRACSGGRIGRPPACYCPQGQRWTGARCIVVATPRPQQPPAQTQPQTTRRCPPGKYLLAGYCRPRPSRQPKADRPPIDYGGRPKPSGTLIK